MCQIQPIQRIQFKNDGYSPTNFTRSEAETRRSSVFINGNRPGSPNLTFRQAEEQQAQEAAESSMRMGM